MPAAVIVIIVTLAGMNWVLAPEQAGRWLESMLLLPFLWLALSLWHLWTLRSVQRLDSDDASAIAGYFRAALALMIIGIGIRQIAVLGLEIWVSLGDRSTGLAIEQRVLGLATSAVFIVIGNALPKILTPFAMLPPGRAALVSIARRFIGRGWVVLGLVMALGFLLTPLDFAETLQAWSVISGLVLMAGAIVWMNLAPDRVPDDQ